jgi:succinylglutamate desuccinylase
MIYVKSFALNEKVNINRVLGVYSQDKEGPLLLITAGIHGNEPSGIFAMIKILNCLKFEQIPIKGKLIGLAGNLAALNTSSRYIYEDMNRMFYDERFKNFSTQEICCNVEEIEVKALLEEFEKLEKEKFTKRYFLDCHTTSSESQPFACVFKGKGNYEFAEKFPIHTIHGLGSELKGTWAKYLIENGYTGFTFEAGQHQDLSSIENQEAAIWLALVESGCIKKEDLPNYEHSYEILAKNTVEGKKVFDVIEHYRITSGEEFEMNHGFVNFQQIEKGTLLAKNKKGKIFSRESGRILMPLYQKLGEDGYFIIKEHDKAFLQEERYKIYSHK